MRESAKELDASDVGAIAERLRKLFWLVAILALLGGFGAILLAVFAGEALAGNAWRFAAVPMAVVLGLALWLVAFVAARHARRMGRNAGRDG